MSLVKCGVTRDRNVKGLKGNLSKRQCSSSFKAVRQAVNSLHRLDDFDSEEIGAGFFSKIYRVVHKTTKQVLVLKMNVKEGNEPNVRREIDMMNKLSHPNIIKFYGVCISKGQMHALMEYIDGGSLDQLLLDHSVQLSWTLRIQIACDIAKGLKYLHSNDYMHRDLTSKNILIKKYSDGRRAAVVADLGLADKIPSSETPVCIVGSPYWMAPECLMGKVYNQKADVFSYGIILCEVIARVDADPEILPRTKKFGVDYVKFCSMSSDCPLHFLHQTFVCCQIDPSKRPSFKKIVSSLQVLKSSTQMAVILADLNRLGIVNNGKNILNRMLLEKILEEKLKQRKMSVVEDGGGITSQSSPQHRHHISPASRHNLPFVNNKNLDITSSIFNATITDYDKSTRNKLIPHTLPSSYHNASQDAYENSNQRKFVPVTPMIVGKVMSRDDVYYAPHLGNPFPASLRRDKLVDKYTNTTNLSYPNNTDSTDNHLKITSTEHLKVDSKDFLTHSNSILNDCSAYLEMHSHKDHSPAVSHKRLEPVHNHLIWPSIFSPNMSSLSYMAPHNDKSNKSSFLPVRLFRSISLPDTLTSFFPDEGVTRLNTTLTTFDKVVDAQDSKADRTITKNNLEMDVDIAFITKQPKRQSFKRSEGRKEYTYISGSSSFDSALGREEEEEKEDGGVSTKRPKHKIRLRKIHSFYGCGNANRKALIKRNNIYKNFRKDGVIDDLSGLTDNKDKTDVANHHRCNNQTNPSQLSLSKLDGKKEEGLEHEDSKDKQTIIDKNYVNNASAGKSLPLTTSEFSRFHFRTSSAVVCRSSSVIYNHHPLTEQALLTRYLEEMLKSGSSNKSRRQGVAVAEDGGFGVLRNKLLKVGSCDEEHDKNESENSDTGEDETDARTMSDYDDDDYFTSSLRHTHQLNNPCCSPGSFYSLDDNLYPSSSSCADQSTTSSLAPDRDTMENRQVGSSPHSNKKIVEMIKDWEDKTDEKVVKGCGDDLCAFHNHANIHDFSKSKQCSFHYPLSSQYLKPMEFAEFYLYRRFQELKQKWEQNQQQ